MIIFSVLSCRNQGGKLKIVQNLTAETLHRVTVTFIEQRQVTLNSKKILWF